MEGLFGERYSPGVHTGFPQGGDSTLSYPGCVGSNWREMGPFWTGPGGREMEYLYMGVI